MSFSILSRFQRLLITFILLLSGLASVRGAIPDLFPVEELKAGMEGEVRTVFAGTKIEPFKVKVVGVLRNGLGPGRHMIICELTDPRVQNMGATAGMSGSPLYIGGRLVGALSYQLMQFETVRHAGFTPAADLLEVASLDKTKPVGSARFLPAPSSEAGLQSAFSFGGLSPEVAALVAPSFAELGLRLNSLAGGDAGKEQGTSPRVPLEAGGVVAAALMLGDVSMVGTGTISLVDGEQVIAFGHPMLGLGDTEIPMCSAEILTILASNMSSTKLSNVGAVIGTIRQDRLSAISGKVGPGPEMMDVRLSVKRGILGPRALAFRVVKHPQLTPLLTATGVLQGIQRSNDAGFAEGYRVLTKLYFTGGRHIESEAFIPGPAAVGLRDLLVRMAQVLGNPYEKLYPERVDVEVEPLAEAPQSTLESFQLSRTQVQAGDTLEASLSWRDHQGRLNREKVAIPVRPEWVGKTLDVALVPGRILDELTEPGRTQIQARYRSFDAYLQLLASARRTDGLYLVVLERGVIFADQAETTRDMPLTLERIARQSDESRFQKFEAAVPLFEKFLAPGRLINNQAKKQIQVLE